MSTLFARELFACAFFKKKFSTYFPLKFTFSSKKIKSVPINLKKSQCIKRLHKG